MALRKQTNKDASDIPSGSQLMDENSQEDKPLGDRDNNDELSSSLLVPSSREKYRRERENKPKPKEMTEEEMMDLALRLSEQEASVTALRLQKEEEAVMKAIQESMVGQTQHCLPSQSQSLLADPEASFRLCSRRKLLYSNGKPASAAVDQGASETDLKRAAKGTGDESKNRNIKRKRKEESPLLEMPDLSQTQIYSQASPCSSEPLDSPQSSDSTQIVNCQLRKSPVFPSTGCRAEVHVPRLSQNLLETCRSSGFVLCSQDSWTSPQKSPPTHPRSPTFPKSPKRSSNLTLSKSPVFSENDQGDDEETELSPECLKSPVFGRNTHDRSPRACRPQVSVCNPEFMFSSQESLFSSGRSTSCRPTSPVFPKSPSLPKNTPPQQKSAICKSPVFSETDGGQTEQSHGGCASPVFGRTVQRQKISLDVQKLSAGPSATELRGSGSEGNSTASRGSSLRQDGRTDHDADTRFNKSFKSDDAEELRETSKDLTSAETELTSDVTLLWSDEDDDDVTPVGSPSPVFPEERPVHQAESQAASLNHVTAASPGTSGSNCRVSASPGEPAGGQTVHYYWGVPFCPRGLDPDAYTQVIVAQMEVYEKSLKQAQRCLLRKAEWGEAVLPQPEKSPSPESPSPESPQHHVPRRRDLRLRGKKLCKTAGISPATAEEEEEEEEEEERESKEEEKSEGGGGGQVDTDDSEVCPETQLSDDRMQDLMMDTDAGAELQPKSPELPEVEMILQDDSPAGGETQEEQMELEVDAPVERNIPVSSSDFWRQNVRKEEIEDQDDPDVEEIKDRGFQRSASPELDPAAVPPSPETNVDCPICQASFPVMEIEMHAAYCDGEVAVVDERRPKADCFQVSLKPRRMRTRKAEVTAEETNASSNTSRNQEKCYICQKAVPVRGYSRHTELCIQRQAAKSAAKGNLLSALEQTESRDSEAGPSGSKLQPGDIIDLRDDDDDDDEEEEVDSALRISNSPIRSFTPISEATGCLIDFKKQQRAKKLSQRRR